MTGLPTREEAIREARELRVKNPILRRALVVLGWISLALGIVGIPLPVLPTTPFLLLTAALWARSSERFFLWLLLHPRLGPPIVAYRRDGAISRRAKALAVTMIALSMGFSITYVVPVMAGKVGMALIGLSVSAWILTRPSGPPATGSESTPR